MDLVIRLALQLTPCSTTCTTEDFVNVLESLSENYAWDKTGAYQSYLNRILRSHGAHVLLCALVFLLVAESMHFRHSKLTSDELRKRMRVIGHCTFTIFVTIPRLGMIVARAADIVVNALGSPALMFSLILASMLLALDFPLLLSGLPDRTTYRPGERPPARAGAEPRTLCIDSPFEEYGLPPIQVIVVDIEVSAHEDMHACPGWSDSIPDEGGGKSVLYVLCYSP
ncbi:hypothetical protein EV401DRAFT_2077412 [Pisolithus croceorrhizus]|nr:hypothetical protein EV401DRAFT_2077412 [Pisolithus croceorrhizus]